MGSSSISPIYSRDSRRNQGLTLWMKMRIAKQTSVEYARRLKNYSETEPPYLFSSLVFINIYMISRLSVVVN